MTPDPSIDPQRLLERARRTSEPQSSLAALRELRAYLDELEAEAIWQGRRAGLSWGTLARVLQVTRQAVLARAHGYVRRGLLDEDDLRPLRTIGKR